MVHYGNTVEISVEVVVTVDEGVSFGDAVRAADKLRDRILMSRDIKQAEVFVNLTPVSVPLIDPQRGVNRVAEVTSVIS